MAPYMKKLRYAVFVTTFLYFSCIFVILQFLEESESFMKALNVQQIKFSRGIRTTTNGHVNHTNSRTVIWQSSFPTRNEFKFVKKFNVPSDRDNPKLASNTIVENDLEKIDWNDYERMAIESVRQGPGEQGQGYTQTLNNEEQEMMNTLMEKYKYNAFASDHISLERSLKDTRTDVCKKKLFLKNIQENSVSFVIIFNNERNTTLLRTIYGIVNRSPERLLREIVLVDDLSTNEELKDPLEDYISKHFMKVRVVRNKERQGLVRSRMIGANHTSGSFLVFLDAHVEVNVNFLPPLIEPMVLDYRTIVCPMVDNTMAETLEVKGLIYRERGAFDWHLVYQRLPVYQEDESEPHPVPTMLGCAFAISRRWWEEVGMFDPGLEIWGGEQYEISFKSWMCGGKVVDAPCSRVAHLFRSLPYLKKLLDNKFDLKNYLRVASVWMDEYKEYLFQRRPQLRDMDPGDLTSQHELRKRLNCKSFDWYMKEVAPDIPKYFPLIEPPLKAWGKIKSNLNASLCITTVQIGLSLVMCNQSNVSQYRYDWRIQIRELYDRCFTNPSGDFILVWTCFLVEEKPTQMFVWDRTTGHIVNGYTKYCVDYKIETLALHSAECNNASLSQSWTFEVYNETLVDSTFEQHKHLFNLAST